LTVDFKGLATIAMSRWLLKWDEGWLLVLDLAFTGTV